MTKLTLYIKGIGFLVGMIFGAGIFALPYAFLQAGLFWSLFHLAFALFFILVLHIFYGEIAFLTGGKHRFPGYVKKYLGDGASQIALLITVLGYCGILLVYGLLGGIFIHNVFPQFGEAFLSLGFFAFGAILLLFQFEKIGLVNFYLTLPLFGFIFYLFLLGIHSVRIENFFIEPTPGAWFFPYGIWIFALTGFATLPEARDIFNHQQRGGGLNDFKKVIVLSILISLLFYLIFVFAVLGSAGVNTTPDALSGLEEAVGKSALVVGSIIGFLAVFTSYLALGTDFKNIFRFDYKLSFGLSWLLAALPPAVLYLFGLQSFVKILSFIGAVALGFTGTFIVLMSLRLHKFFPEHKHLVSPKRRILNFILILGLAAGVVLEVSQLLF